MKDYKKYEDEKLMKLYQEGDYLAFETLYHRHKGRIYSFLLKRLENKQSVDEVFQNIFVKLHKNVMKYDSKFKFTTWLFTITRSVHIDYLRKRKAEFVEFDEEKFRQNEVSNTADTIGVEELKNMRELSGKEGEAIRLRYFEDAEYEEISKLLNTSQAGVRKLVSRGIKKIRTRMLGRVSL